MVNFSLTDVLTQPWAVPVIFGCMIPILAIIVGGISGCITKLGELKLKRCMIERGYTPADIEQVINAGVEDAADGYLECETVPNSKT